MYMWQRHNECTWHSVTSIACEKSLLFLNLIIKCIFWFVPSTFPAAGKEVITWNNVDPDQRHPVNEFRGLIELKLNLRFQIFKVLIISDVKAFVLSLHIFQIFDKPTNVHSFPFHTANLIFNECCFSNLQQWDDYGISNDIIRLHVNWFAHLLTWRISCFPVFVSVSFRFHKLSLWPRQPAPSNHCWPYRVYDFMKPLDRLYKQVYILY